MSIFRRKQKGSLGVDFGAGGIKVVQLAPSGKGGVLFTYGFIERAPEESGGDYLENQNASAALLRQICLKAKTTTKLAVSALPIPTVFSAVLSIAAVPKKELSKAVEWEAKKLIPLPLEEVRLDFQELKFKSSAEKSPQVESGLASSAAAAGAREVLLTAAPRSIIDKYVAMARAAGLTLVSLETEAFALIRSLLGQDPTPTIILDIGAVRSNILMVDRSVPILTRSVEIGGKRCTEAIASNLGVNLTQAESLKRDASLRAPGLTVSPGIPELLNEVLKPLINELKYSFHVYRTRNIIARPPERIILTGGGSQIPGFSEFLSSEFNLRTFIGDPWQKVEIHPDLRLALQTLSSRFAVAIGLALRNLA